jgi:hypothetical protein
MEYDKDKVDDVTLALMYLVTWKPKKEFPWSAWKSFDWDTLDRLHEKGLISDPKSKAKSVVLSDEAFQRAEQLFNELFGKENK